MKKKLQLQTVIHIKDSLSRDIVELQKDIIKYNNSEKKVDTLFETLDKKEAQMIVIKEAIQKANRDKHKDGKTNNYYIYRLSNLNGKRVMIQDLLQEHNAKTSQQSEESLKKDLSNILSEIDTVKSSLKTFNRDHKITVILDESLNLLNE